MRQIVAGLVVLCGFMPASVRAQADDPAGLKALIDKAVQALGGEAKLAKLQAGTWKGKGHFEMEGQQGDLTVDGAVQGLDRCRLDLGLVMDGRTMKVRVVINGNKVWAKPEDRDQVEELPAEIRAVVLANMHAVRYAHLPLLLRGKELTLAPLGEVKVGAKPAVGVKVTQKERPDISLFFDKETSLPLKCELRAKEMDGGPEVTHEYLFDDYKETDGLKHFRKVTFKRDGTKLFELELSEVKAEGKLDEGTFAMP